MNVVAQIGGLVVAAGGAFVLMQFARRREEGQVRGTSRARRGLLPALFGDTGLVAAREARERIRGRTFRVVTLILLVVMAAAIVIPALYKGKSHPQQVGVVGSLFAPLRAAASAAGRSVGTRVHLVSESDVAAARDGLRSGGIDVAIVNAREVMVNKAIASGDTSTTAQFARALASTLGTRAALQAAGLSPAQIAQLAGAKSLPVVSLQPGPASRATRNATLACLIVIFC